MSLLEDIAENYPHLLKMDGYDAAIIGIVERPGLEAICYDYRKVIEILMSEMSEDEAREYFSFNMIGAYMGEFTPVFLMEEL